VHAFVYLAVGFKFQIKRNRSPRTVRIAFHIISLSLFIHFGPILSLFIHLHAIPGLLGIAALASIFFYMAGGLSTNRFGQSHPEWFGANDQNEFSFRSYSLVNCTRSDWNDPILIIKTKFMVTISHFQRLLDQPLHTKNVLLHPLTKTLVEPALMRLGTLH
jgi:hypothetical protein